MHRARQCSDALFKRFTDCPDMTMPFLSSRTRYLLNHFAPAWQAVGLGNLNRSNVQAALTTCCWLALVQTCLSTPGWAEEVTFSARIDFGTDRGQSFGSLFEARDRKGRIVAGAGFADVYNTRFRNDRHTLQFFIKAPQAVRKFSLDRLPHPDLDCGVYLFDLDEDVFAWSSIGGNSVRRWHPDRNRWQAELPPGMTRLRSGDGVSRVGAGILAFSDNVVTYNSRPVFAPTSSDRYVNFYYAQGMLCFYRYRTPEGEPITELVAFPWTPDDQRVVQADEAIALRTQYEREVPFAWGQYDDQVLTVSNMGGIYVLEGGKWHTLLAPDDQVSYQVYSLLRWREDLLLAQYPTGEVFAYDGDHVRHLEGWPPRLAGVSPSARECQTLAICGGNLWAGVWPWGELWKYDPNDGQWEGLGRVFSHPKPTDRQLHPYEAEAKRFDLVANHWGQRITSMIPQADALLLATSAKGTSNWEDRYDFLTEAERREYGAVLRLTVPGNLAAQISWRDKPIDLEFTVTPQKLTVRQDGHQVAIAQHGLGWDAAAEELNVTWGTGVFGPGTARIDQPRIVSGARSSAAP